MTAPTHAPTRSGHLVIGVDTHKDLHVAAAVDTIGGTVDTLTIANDSGGFTQLIDWAAALGQIIAIGVEGTGSYGQALTVFLNRYGCQVIEVNRPDRAARRTRGKSDAIDAENAARAVLARYATATPKSADGHAESIRRLKVGYDSAVKARTQAMQSLRSLLIQVDDELKRECAGLGPIKLCQRLARLRPGAPTDPQRAGRLTLRRLAHRWLDLDAEAREYTSDIETIIKQHAPDLLALFGVGVDTAAEILIAVGDNPERLHSEAALAKLAGACPIPAGSGKTNGRNRLNRGGNRQLNSALHYIVLCRMKYHEPTRSYMVKRTLEGKSKREAMRCLKRYLVREIYRTVKQRPKTVIAQG